MKLKPGVNWILQNFAKRDIASALVVSRANLAAELDRSSIQVREMFEMKEALGLLPENVSHKEVMDHIRVLVNGADIEITEGPENESQ